MAHFKVKLKLIAIKLLTTSDKCVPTRILLQVSCKHILITIILTSFTHLNRIRGCLTFYVKLSPRSINKLADHPLAVVQCHSLYLEAVFKEARYSLKMVHPIEQVEIYFIVIFRRLFVFQCLYFYTEDGTQQILN